MRPPSTLIRTRLPAKGPSEGTGIFIAEDKAASRREISSVAVAQAIRFKVELPIDIPFQASISIAS